MLLSECNTITLEGTPHESIQLKINSPFTSNLLANQDVIKNIKNYLVSLGFLVLIQDDKERTTENSMIFSFSANIKPQIFNLKNIFCWSWHHIFSNYM